MNKQFSLYDCGNSSSSSGVVVGTADEIIQYLQKWKTNNMNPNKKFEGKVIQFNYKKDNSCHQETKTVKVDIVDSGYLRGYDLTLSIQDGYRSYREDRIVGKIISIN